jgi:hypothetical protein
MPVRLVLFQGLSSEERLEAAAQTNLQASQRGSWKHAVADFSSKERFDREGRSFPEDLKRFFKLFQESTFEGSRAAARKMRKIAERETKHNQTFLLFHSLCLLVHSSDKEILSWPNSPLLVLLQFVDPNVLTGGDDATLQEGEGMFTPLHDLAEMADRSDYSTHGKQLILAKQLIEHGANVNSVSKPHGRDPLHNDQRDQP